MGSNYKRAGIDDVSAFYARKFIDATKADDYFEDPLRRYDITRSRSRWFDRQIEPGTDVLDFGCGVGSLSFLSKKGCRVYGIELSVASAERAREAGYAQVHVGDIDDAPDWPLFDYIASADVFGHIEFDDKDRVIEALKRLLKPGGIMLHAIECAAIDYDALSDEALREFIHIDGHVGMESRTRILERFGKFFAHTDGEVRFIHGRAYDDIVKEVASNGGDYQPELKAYLMSLGSGERLAFNVATGMVFNSLEWFRVPSDDRGGGMMLLRASDAPLRKRINHEFNGETATAYTPGSLVALDSPALLTGWHTVENDGAALARWSEPRAVIHLPVTNAVKGMKVSFVSPATLEPTIVHFGQKSGSGIQLQCTAELGEYTAVIPRVMPLECTDQYFSLEIETEHVHVPCWRSDSNDDRRLGIYVKSIKLY